MRAAMYAQIGKYLKYGPVLLNLWIGLVGDVLTPAGTKVEHFGFDQLQSWPEPPAQSSPGFSRSIPT